MSLFRSRRSFKPVAMDPARELPRELLTELLTDAHWAPTHGLTQPWRFQVFATLPARERLAAGLQLIYDAITPTAKRDPAKRAKLAASPRSAPVVIALLAHVQPGGKIPDWEEIAATSCAAQSLMLSAHAHGVASYWSSPPAATSPEFVRWLGLDETHRAMGLLYLGYASPSAAVPTSTRLPLNERVTWHEV
jgi:nitroreductase